MRQIGQVEEGRILAHHSLLQRSKDETEIGAGERAGDTGREGHPLRDAATLFRRRQDPDCAGRPARSIAELCRERIVQNLYYRWSKEFLEAGKRRPAGDTARAATSDGVKDLRREASALKEVVAELTLENRLLKKSVTADGEDAE
jgi:transposase-like protein